MAEETKEAVTVADLERIFIRAQTPQGRWVSINCTRATDIQFDAWIRTRIAVQGDDTRWEPQDRATVCDILWQAGALHMLTKEGAEELREG